MTSDARAAVAAEIQAHYDDLQSWRKVKKLYYPTVPPGTLCTIAKSGGAKIPKKHWRALGLVAKREPMLPGERRVRRHIGEMAKRTRESVLRRK